MVMVIFPPPVICPVMRAVTTVASGVVGIVTASVPQYRLSVCEVIVSTIPTPPTNVPNWVGGVPVRITVLASSVEYVFSTLGAADATVTPTKRNDKNNTDTSET
jgi:hypothetical protein